MKYLIVCFCILASTASQRSGYLSGNAAYPELANRFKTGEESSTTLSPLGNRLGVDGTTEKLPIDARGDRELVDRLLTWPRENRPYWLVNYKIVEDFRNQQNRDNLIQQGQEQRRPQQTNLERRFGGPSNSNPTRNLQSSPSVDYDDFGNPIYPR
ncbi:hypothetical protein FQA39_LY08852 [Lamprigera yunnana]|nr:hypothetical protein FQA39_LY08852 [Lamprigera yunnana]